MRFLIAVATLLALGSAQTPNKAAFITKIVNMGVKIPTKAQIKEICTCMETPLWQQQSIDNLTTSGTNCVMGAMMSSFGDLYTLYDNVNTCLDKCPATNSSPVEIATNLATQNMGQGLTVFSQLTTLINKAKTNKKTKTQGMENVYKWGATLFSKDVINTYCTNLVKSGAFTNCQWQCVLSGGKSVVNFSLYKCSTLKPPSK